MFFTAKIKYPDFPDTCLAGECSLVSARGNYSKSILLIIFLEKYQVYTEDNTLIVDGDKLTKYEISKKVRIIDLYVQ